MADNIGAAPSLQRLANTLGGEVHGDQIRCPGPGHSAVDRSLSVKLSKEAPDGFLVNSFADDDPIKCRDYVREKAGFPPFKPNSRQRLAVGVIEQAVLAAVNAQQREGPKGRVTGTYDYSGFDGTLLYQVLRYEPKAFSQRRPDGRGGWTDKLDGVRRVPYRLPELNQYPDGSVFVTEGEKDADRVAALGYCATTVASGNWTEDCIKQLAGRDVIVLEDNDDAGRRKARDLAALLHGIAKTIRVVSLPDLAHHGDVSDWLDADPRLRRNLRRYVSASRNGRQGITWCRRTNPRPRIWHCPSSTSPRGGISPCRSDNGL